MFRQNLDPPNIFPISGKYTKEHLFFLWTDEKNHAYLRARSAVKFRLWLMHGAIHFWYVSRWRTNSFEIREGLDKEASFDRLLIVRKATFVKASRVCKSVSHPSARKTTGCFTSASICIDFFFIYCFYSILCRIRIGEAKFCILLKYLWLII